MDTKGQQVIREVTQAILGENNAGLHCVHPDKVAIRKVLEQIQYILFPEFFTKEGYAITEYTVGAVVEEVLSALIEQIAIVFHSEDKYQPGSEGEEEAKKSSCAKPFAPERDKHAHAREVARAFLATFPRIREVLWTDIEAAYEGDPAAYCYAEIVISYPGFYAIMVQRLAHELHLLGVPFIPRIMTEHAHSITGIDIHPGATIGSYFFIDHGTGIVIGETTIIGEHVKIYQGVTLGALSTRGGQRLKGAKRHPTIEDYVTIYAGASILGGDTVIGENAVIGGNAFITSTVPGQTRVSVKNPELQFKNSHSRKSKRELDQASDWYYSI